MNLKYCKKPVVIEAFQMTKERRSSNADWPEWLHRAWLLDREAPGSLYPTEEGTSDGTLSIRTLEGQHLVSWGDWIIQGVKGELYPCKPDIFEMTYEAQGARERSLLEGTFIYGAYRWQTIGCSFLCPRCGYQWARIRSIQPGFLLATAYCSNCPSPWPRDVPGSLCNLAESLLDGHGAAHLPLELLPRELELHIKWLHAAIDNATEWRHNRGIEPPTPQAMNTLNERIAELRSKVLSNTATAEELREGLRILRAERMGAAERRTERKTVEAKVKAPVDVNVLLAKLGVKS